MKNQNTPTSLRRDIEALRTVCSFGIVWFHSQIPQGHSVAHSALIVFLCLSGYLASFERGSLWQRFIERCKRLLMPWATWFTVYAIVYLRKNQEQLPESANLVAWILSGGASIHLWYLPFAVFALTTLDVIKSFSSGRVLLLFCGSIAAFWIATSALWYPALKDAQTPLPHYACGIAAILIGPILKRISIHFPGYRALLTGIALAIICWYVMPPDLRLQYSIAMAAMAVVASGVTASMAENLVSKLGSYTLSAYLSHVLFLRLSLRLFGDNLSVVACSAWVMSIVAGALVAKLAPQPLKKWLG